MPKLPDMLIKYAYEILQIVQGSSLAFLGYHWSYLISQQCLHKFQKPGS